MIFPLHRATEAVPWEGTALRWWVLDALPSGDACDASPGPRPRNHLAPLVFSAARNYGDISIYIYLIWFKISNFQKIHENTVYPIDSYSISFKYCGWNMWINDFEICMQKLSNDGEMKFLELSTPLSHRTRWLVLTMLSYVFFHTCMCLTVVPFEASKTHLLI